MSKRIAPTWTVTVDRPPATVFDYLADLRRLNEWSPKPYRVEGLADRPIGVGTTFTSYGWVPNDSEHRNEVTVTELDRPNRVTFESKEGEAVYYNHLVVTPAGSGSTVERTMDMPVPGGFVGLMFPLLLRMVIRPNVQKGMNMLKANVEGGG